MGLHTWFYRDKNLYLEQKEIYDILDKHETGEIYLDAIEVYRLNTKVSEISERNDADYHDVFRTVKREANGDYTHDTIMSEQECFEWVEKSENRVIWYNKEQELQILKRFWREHPDGCIDFG